MSKDIGTIDCLIPTWNNPQLLGQAISSIAQHRNAYPVRVLVINNGHPDSCNFIPDYPWVKVIQTGGQNLGWEGGLKLGLQQSTSEFVLFMNDDAYVPPSGTDWLRKMVETFRQSEVGAVGPSSNCVMGPQNIWKLIPHQIIETTFLIGFCMMVRRKALEEVGGIDDTLPGGDDLDLSIRLRQKGYKLVARRDVFVFHHGFVTGTRLHGGEGTKGGWNSREMTERTDRALILKHGFAEWFKCRAGLEYPGLRKGVDDEGDKIRPHVQGEKVLDLACGNNKTVPYAVGVDRVPNGESIKNLNAESKTDVVADVEQDMPFEKGSQDTIIARHILEHTLDPIRTLKHWASYLRPCGTLIIAVPDERQFGSISLNPEHVHAFTPDSMASFAEAAGLVMEGFETTSSASFVSILKKPEKRCSCHPLTALETSGSKS